MNTTTSTPSADYVNDLIATADRFATIASGLFLVTFVSLMTLLIISAYTLRSAR